MEVLLEKISSYNILNNLIPGAIFTFAFKFLYVINMDDYSVIEKLILYYFIGMILSRIGSLIIEPLFIKLKIVSNAA